ncbi:MAG TPA: hypothetical protein VFV34_10545 [Blastocatellia bacterium]|nr:hypothetical protein [Blastocatellia bacterium]
MTDRFFPEKQIRNAAIARPVSSRVFGWLALIAVAGSLVTTAFLVSARRNLQAVTLGYQTEQLREQSASLEEKLRRLELERARVTSPLELEKRAKAIGMERPRYGSGRIRRPTSAR